MQHRRRLPETRDGTAQSDRAHPCPGHTVALEGTRVVGVAYLHDGETHEVNVTREVILSGGAINSPHLLLLSGVGPAAQLAALDIPVVVDLPWRGAKSSGPCICHTSVVDFQWVVEPLLPASITCISLPSCLASTMS